MQRNIDINTISDGKKYRISDMVKIGCNDCEGCNKCCENMSGLITLDPYDIHRMTKGIECSFENLVDTHIEFSMDRGVLIPTLMMDKNTGKCTFLNEAGRCQIHRYRSGICRLFPMGRLYEEGFYYYFLQKDECPHENKTKVKLKNWLDTEDVNRYEKFVSDWHYFLSDIQKYMEEASEEEIQQINVMLIKIFYQSPYVDTFYEDFYKRLDKVKSLL